MKDASRCYALWFYAAALYNAAWGLLIVAFPRLLLQPAGLSGSGAEPLAQVVGMMVGVFAYGYYLLAREPHRYAGFIWIALAGKTLGPAGFLYSALTRTLPWHFGWVCLFNDAIWWPVFWKFALERRRVEPP